MEELEYHQVKGSEIIKSQLKSKNECLDKISQEVVGITKSLNELLYTEYVMNKSI